MQQLDLNSLNIFAKVVETRSFTAAAKRLGIPKSKVSRSISSLEEALNAQLLYRTTRDVELTSFGQKLFANCQSGIESLHLGLQHTFHETTPIDGHVKVTSVEDLGVAALTPLIIKFSELYPRLHIEMVYTTDVLDMVKQSIDVALRVGQVSQQSYRARKVGIIKFILVASPRYLQRFEKHIEINDLSNTDLLLFNGANMQAYGLNLFCKGEHKKIAVIPRFQSTSTMALLELAKAGRGIAVLPEIICEDALKRELLVPVCKGWHTKEKPVSIVTPSRRKPSPVVDLFTDYLYQNLRGIFV